MSTRLLYLWLESHWNTKHKFDAFATKWQGDHESSKHGRSVNKKTCAKRHRAYWSHIPVQPEIQNYSNGACSTIQHTFCTSFKVSFIWKPQIANTTTSTSEPTSSSSADNHHTNGCRVKVYLSRARCSHPTNEIMNTKQSSSLIQYHSFMLPEHCLRSWHIMISLMLVPISARQNRILKIMGWSLWTWIFRCDHTRYFNRRSTSCSEDICPTSHANQLRNPPGPQARAMTLSHEIRTWRCGIDQYSDLAYFNIVHFRLRCDTSQTVYCGYLEWKQWYHG